jgi:N-acetylglutamate synthase-like GNAT family acetyltransferase
MLKYIAVDPDYRLRGVGASLLTYLEHAAAQAGAEAVEVKARKKESDGFYSKMGYTAVAGIKAGVEYAKGTYVSKDRKFVEGEVLKEKKKDG